MTPVTVVINYLTMMSDIVVICSITCVFFNFKALIDVTKDDGRSLYIIMPFIHQMPPLFCIINVCRYVVTLRNKWLCLLPK